MFVCVLHGQPRLRVCVTLQRLWLCLFPNSVGFILGFALCATLFSVVSSAVNTVIVCYAEAPNEFQQNHPQLSEEMRAAWRQAWPNEFRY